MSEQKTPPRPEKLVFEYELDAAPDKVWRAISVSEYRDQWLPAASLVEEQPVSVTPGREVSYRICDDTPPCLESVVTFLMTPNSTGGTTLKIIHELDDPRLFRGVMAANSNRLQLCRAA